MWNDLNKDLTKLVIKGKPTEEQVFNGWLVVYQGYIDQCGINKRFKNILSKQKRLALLEIEYALTNDRKILTKLDIERESLNNMTTKKIDGKNDFIIVCKWFGQILDRKTVLAKDFYGIVVMMQNEHERLKDEHNKKG